MSVTVKPGGYIEVENEASKRISRICFVCWQLINIVSQVFVDLRKEISELYTDRKSIYVQYVMENTNKPQTIANGRGLHKKNEEVKTVGE